MKQRQHECGAMFDVVKKRFASYSKETLLREAFAFCENEMTAGRQIPAPDRIDRRQRTSLLAWYCRHYKQIDDNSFITNVSSMKRRGPRRSLLLTLSSESMTETEQPSPKPPISIAADEDTNIYEAGSDFEEFEFEDIDLFW
jgi:hypothetical protein